MFSRVEPILSNEYDVSCSRTEHLAPGLTVRPHKNVNGESPTANLLRVGVFDMFLYALGKQPRTCQDSHLLIHTVPGKVSRMQLTNIKYPFFRQ